MPYLFIGLALLGLFLLGARLLVNADPTRLGRFLGWFATGIGVAGALAVLVLLVASDRLGLALFVASGAAPVLMRWRANWRRHHAAPSGSDGGHSQVETELLRMRLDHGSGAMSGQVKRGPFAGRRLEDLALSELLDLWRQCVAEDQEGTRLLETYLDRLRPDWRKSAAASATPGETMTREQAYAILGLEPGGNAEQIKDAHRRLMMKLHPDHGGSTFLASQINRAKDLLLGD